LQCHYLENTQRFIRLSQDISLAAVVFGYPSRDKHGGHRFVIFARAAKMTADDL